MTARAFIAGALFGALVCYLYLSGTPHPQPPTGRQRFKRKFLEADFREQVSA